MLKVMIGSNPYPITLKKNFPVTCKNHRKIMSTVILKHFGKMSDSGNPFFYHVDLWNEQRLSLRGKEFEITIKERHRKPSVSQFSYYWGGILRTCLQHNSFQGYDSVEDLHKCIFQPMFLGYQVRVVVGGKKYDKHMVKSLTELNKKETAEFIENVLNFVAQEGVIILQPEQYQEKYYKEINLDKE